MKVDENDLLSFLGIKFGRENNKYEALIYCKPTFSGVFRSFEGFLPET